MTFSREYGIITEENIKGGLIDVVLSGKKMIINRVWAMPNKWTFQIPPIRDLVARYVGDGKGWIDPFAGMTSPAEFTNDLNPEMPAKFHLDALDFLKQLQGQYKGVLFDPPYSYRQVQECYAGVGREFTMYDSQYCVRWTYERAEIGRLIRPGGLAISCGWNSQGIGKQHGFELEEILLVAHGAAHNDTIVTVEQKVQSGF